MHFQVILMRALLAPALTPYAQIVQTIEKEKNEKMKGSLKQLIPRFL